jgi:hypothetical protein
MTAPIRQRAPLAASAERVIVRRGASRRDRAVAAAGVLPAKPRHAGWGLISLPCLSAHAHDDVTWCACAVNWISHARRFCMRSSETSGGRRGRVLLLTSPACPSPAAPPSACLQALQADPGNGPATLPRGGPQAGVRLGLPVIGLLTWSRRTTPPGMPSLARGGPVTVFPAGPLSSPRSPLAAQQRAPAVKSAAGAGLRERGSVRRRRHVQPRAHDHILGVHQCAAIFPSCPASGQRRISF